jgi:hypoxanthine phosphoribosyltransferase
LEIAQHLPGWLIRIIMKKIKLLDKEFELYIPYEKIRAVIEQIAQDMNRDLDGKNPLFVCVLNGAFMFAADLFKRIDVPGAQITFVKMASYHGVHSSGTIRQLIGLSEAIEGRSVVVVEDIVDSGSTIEEILAQLAILKPLEVKIATLLSKPDAMIKEVKLDYVGLEIPNDFIVGYGLDYDGYGRNLIDIYSIVQ